MSDAEINYWKYIIMSLTCHNDKYKHVITNQVKKLYEPVDTDKYDYSYI